MLSHPENSRKQEIHHQPRTHFHLQSVTVVTVVTVFSAYPPTSLSLEVTYNIYNIYNKLNIIITI